MTKVDHILAEVMELTDDERSELADRLAKVVPLVVANTGGRLDDMDEEERTALLKCLDESFEDEKAGRVRDLNTVVEELRSR